MSLFAGPDYSHIIWRPQQFPQGESGIGGLMAGLGSGMQAGGDYKKAKGAWEEGGKKGQKPSAFKFFFGTAPEQQEGNKSSVWQSSSDALRQPNTETAPGQSQAQVPASAPAAPPVPQAGSMMQRKSWMYDVHDAINQMFSQAESKVARSGWGSDTARSGW